MAMDLNAKAAYIRGMMKGMEMCIRDRYSGQGFGTVKTVPYRSFFSMWWMVYVPQDVYKRQALQAALGYFEAAGYTVENGQVTAAPALSLIHI